MQCFACNYDDEQEAEKFLYLDIIFPTGEILEHVVFYNPQRGERKSFLYACPECGTVKIDLGE